MSQSRKFCTFFLEGHCYGVPVECVREVLRQHEIRRVPLAPREVCGLINLRGQIVTVIDLRRRLSLPERNPLQCGTHVIVECNSGVVSFLVDSLGDVREMAADQFESPPATLRGVGRELIVGTYKTPQDLFMVLDVAQLADVHSRAEAN